MKRLVLLIVAAGISMFAYAGGADVLKQEVLDAYGPGPGGYYVRYAARAYSDGYEYTYVAGRYWYCYGYTSDLKVTGSAKHGSASVSTADLYCVSYYGTPVPAELSVECVDNGEVSSSGTSNDKTTYGDGTMYQYHWNYKTNRADCTVDVDGAPYDVGGSLRWQQSVDK